MAKVKIAWKTHDGFTPQQARDSILLAFLIAALNDINIMSCNLENAYLNAPCRKKI
jgi:hypothetical protein